MLEHVWLERNEQRAPRFYFGGLSAAGAACITHPLDLLKVHLQTQQQSRIGLLGMAGHVVKTEGFFGLYNGISASLLRQLSYSTTRFGIYETVKQTWVEKHPGRTLPFEMKLALAGVSGLAGGIAGTPPDMINVRMQNDMKIEPALRRNYKNAVHGLYCVLTQEGPTKLFNGVTMASPRAALMTIGQVACYDQIKQMMVSILKLPDKTPTHLLASSFAAGIATVLTQPADVMKTRLMNAKAGQFTGLGHCARSIWADGPSGFYKGFIPAFVRLLPHTIFTFLIFEQLRLYLGHVPTDTHTPPSGPSQLKSK